MVPMKTVTHYEPPSPEDLAELRHALQYDRTAMAALAGVADGNQWRKYTGGAAPRRASLHMLFFMAARLELPPEQLDAVYQRMRALGCELEFAGEPCPQALQTENLP